MLNRVDDRLTDKDSKLAKTPLKYFTEFLKDTSFHLLQLIHRRMYWADFMVNLFVIVVEMDSR